MKSKEITEGFFKGLAKGIGYDDGSPSIIVRSDGWYLNKLPKSLRGQVQRDKETRLYKVKQPANIQKFNDYYDKAADQKLVIQEPSDLL